MTFVVRTEEDTKDWETITGAVTAQVTLVMALGIIINIFTLA